MKRTPLHHWHLQHGARLVEGDGWLLPAGYGAVGRETAAARASLALADISAFASVGLSGRRVAAVAESLGRDGATARPRGVAALEGRGHVLACRLAQDRLLLLAGTTDLAALTERLGEVQGGPAVLRDDADLVQAGFWLVGPQAEAVLRQLTSLDLSPAAFPPGTCAESGLAGVPAFLVRPPGQYVTSLRMHVAWDLAEYVWERLLDAGREIVPLGLEGLRALGLAAAG
jgi:sarcosine oxidase subunit alpha